MTTEEKCNRTLPVRYCQSWLIGCQNKGGGGDRCAIMRGRRGRVMVSYHKHVKPKCVNHHNFLYDIKIMKSSFRNCRRWRVWLQLEISETASISLRSFWLSWEPSSLLQPSSSSWWTSSPSSRSLHTNASILWLSEYQSQTKITPIF